MADDPTKLFASRAERFPQQDETQTLREAIEKGIDQVPVAGPITTFIVSRFWVPSASRRLEEWLKEFANDFDRHCEDCKVENIVQNEAFISASVQIARIVVSTHQREKLDYLRNALLNIAVGRGVGEIKQQVFLNAIEAFTPAHVKILNLLWRNPNPGWDRHSVPISQRTYLRAIELTVPEVQGQPEVVSAVLADLRNRGFTTMSNADIGFPQGGLLTKFNLRISQLRFELPRPPVARRMRFENASVVSQSFRKKPTRRIIEEHRAQTPAPFQSGSAP